MGLGPRANREKSQRKPKKRLLWIQEFWIRSMLPALPTSPEFGLAKARKDMGFGIENHFSEREEVSRREQKIEILQGFGLGK